MRHLVPPNSNSFMIIPYFTVYLQKTLGMLLSSSFTKTNLLEILKMRSTGNDLLSRRILCSELVRSTRHVEKTPIKSGILQLELRATKPATCRTAQVNLKHSTVLFIQLNVTRRRGQLSRARNFDVAMTGSEFLQKKESGKGILFKVCGDECPSYIERSRMPTELGLLRRSVQPAVHSSDRNCHK